MDTKELFQKQIPKREHALVDVFWPALMRFEKIVLRFKPTSSERVLLFNRWKYNSSYLQYLSPKSYPSSGAKSLLRPDWDELMLFLRSTNLDLPLTAAMVDLFYLLLALPCSEEVRKDAFRALRNFVLVHRKIMDVQSRPFPFQSATSPLWQMRLVLLKMVKEHATSELMETTLQTLFTREYSNGRQERIFQWEGNWDRLESSKFFVKRLLVLFHVRALTVVDVRFFMAMSLVHAVRPDLFRAFQKGMFNGKSKFELLELLFAGFQMPPAVALRLGRILSDDLEREQLEYVLKGGSLRTLPGVPISVTKGVARVLSELIPNRELTINGLVVVAALVAKGVSQSYAEDIYSLHLEHVDGELLLAVAPILENKGVSARQFSVAWDYLISLSKAELMDLNLKSIGLDRLQLKIREWHFQLGKRDYQFRTKLLPSAGIRKWKMKLEGGEEIIIEQLRTEREVYYEGMVQEHCVFSYLWKLRLGKSFIFRLAQLDKTGKQHLLLTIELVGNSIVQIRGVHNRDASPLEQMWIGIWAKERVLNLLE